MCLTRPGEHEVFQREGNNLYCEVPITFAQAALGAEIEVPILGGKTEKLEIPEGTQTGTSFTMRGKGIADIVDPMMIGDDTSITFEEGLSLRRNESGEEQNGYVIVNRNAQTLCELVAKLRLAYDHRFAYFV